MFKYFPAGKCLCFLFFSVTFHWCLALVGLPLGDGFVPGIRAQAVLVMPLLAVISQAAWSLHVQVQPPSPGAGLCRAGHEGCAALVPSSVAGLGSAWQP